ncbi:MAG: flavodoxin family protein [Acidimicrobiales bacterium]
MKSLVIYESMYGNTRVVADAIAEGLSDAGPVEVGSVAEFAPGDAAAFDLLVVGGPTHVHGMSRPRTRESAVIEASVNPEIDAEPGAASVGVREWLDGLPQEGPGNFAAFDTRIARPIALTGSAAKGIAKQMRKHSYEPIAEPMSFVVEESEGPLGSGELKRARQWGSTLGRRLTLAERLSEI